ncbi:leucine-rich repeat protein [Flammeovirga kamogawensis]|uniref:Leucine-rich repeat protein n=1 Tax=Flammeovirga kamogawensis TaxID=373891 RepID=A0ABX8GW14_9BACT|nr:leucine-rich repeat protein [Flammeovirga kamogawensis]MBB6461546.1 hypothetical protein [Flammeovirga kamogawensis]QWG07521.1 leucine-rich repeat protein [Flammeovirga kamogawensis]TRX69335.1 leucine-rich repeat protein [Flammeovirga kamogawensis]
MKISKLTPIWITFLLLAIISKTYSQTTITIDDVGFDAVNGEITDYSGSATDIIIPESFNVSGTEVTVKSIRYYAFQGKGLTNVSFPNTITSIKFLAFAKNELTSVTLPTGLKELGKGSFSSNNITEINGEPSNGIFLGLKEDGTEDNTQLVCYGGTATEIDFIPSTVTVIQSYAFAFSSLTSVEIPDGVVELHDGAFTQNELTTLELPNSITTFHSRVFAENKLTSIVISKNLSKIGFYAFEDNLLTSVIIPEGVTDIGVDAFNSNVLTSVSLPSTLKKIRYRAFLNNQIETINLPSQLEEIEFNAFQSNKLTSITIPASMKTIGTSAFTDNPLTSVIFENNSTINTIGVNAFKSTETLAPIVLPTHTQTNFHSYVDSNLEAYDPGESITDFTLSLRSKILETLSIEDVTFNTSTGSISSYKGIATDIIIPNSFTIDGVEYPIREIGTYAFQRHDISSVIFPDNLQKIGNSAFYQNNLTKLFIPEGCEVGTNCFGYNDIKEFNFPKSMTEIPNGLFSYCNFTEVTIPSTIKTIGSGAFSYNDITTLNLSEGIEEIGSYAFHLNDLTSISLPSSLLKIDKQSFTRNKISQVNIANSSTILGGGAFSSNEITTVNGSAHNGLFYGRNDDGSVDYTIITSYGGTESVINFLSDEVTEIDEYAFSYCSLTSVDLPTNLTNIGYYSFYSTSLNEISLHEGINYIGGGAFRYCRIKTIHFPKSIEYIGSRAFAYNSLTAVTFENESNLKYISSLSFERNYSLDDPIILPTSVVPNFINFYDQDGTIYSAGSGFFNDEKGCFARFSKILALNDVEFEETTGTIINYIGFATDIVIPENFNIDGMDVKVKTIGIGAFSRRNLYSLAMGNSITTIEENAFYSNSTLEDITLSTSLITIGDDAFAGSLPDNGIDLPNTGIWHTSHSYNLGSTVTKIESSNSYKYNHRVYIVDFVDYNNALLKTETLMLGASATAPSPPTKIGYTFDNWDTEFNSVNNNLTVKAEYSINTYTVTFVDHDNTVLKSENVEFEKTATPPDNPSRRGYTFDNWDTEFTSVSNNLTVKAEYNINTYTVTFVDHDDTVLKSENVEFEKTATPPDNPTRRGYTFDNWDTEFNSVSNNLTVKAEYNINTYTVTFVDHDDTVLKSENVEFEKTATPPDNPIRSGYIFSNWDVNYESITEDITIKALYNVVITYTVNFNDYNGTLLKSEIVISGNTATAPSDPSRIGYIFTGWDIAFDLISEDLIVTAMYKISTFTVTFKDHDGLEIKSEEVDYKDAATAPENPTRSGYTFIGWDTTFDIITADLIVTATYEINTYTVIFKDHDGSIIKSEEVNYKAPATAPENPTRSGYSFIGWDTTFNEVTDNLTVIALYDVLTVRENQPQVTYTIYPNPVSTSLNIDLIKDGKTHQVYIYNISGQVVYSNEKFKTSSISVVNWKTGTYYLVIDKERTKVIKL